MQCRSDPAWPDVRAAAIRAAIHKGHDYAAALGGTLDSVEHIADTGLLNAGGDTGTRPGRAFMAAALSSAEDSGTPSLDPVQQELTATIEARFTTTGGTLAGHQARQDP